MKLWLCFLLIFFPACSPSVEGSSGQVCFDDQCFRVEIVRTQKERSRGLQSREFLGKTEGMLFIFQESKPHNFWMKETLIPLDIIWMDQNRHIVFIASNVLPCKTEQCPVYTPSKSASYVLEVNAGVTTELGLKVGSVAKFRLSK